MAAKHIFEYQAPDENQIQMIKKLREQYRLLYEAINALLPDSREKSLAITNLEQSNMWANKAVVFSVPKIGE